MTQKDDSYLTIDSESKESLFKDRNSKFIGCAFPINNKNQIKQIIEAVKKRHHSARHWCYAYQLGVNHTYYRVNDDGEPSNSAGMPIYGQIQSFNLKNICVVVVRYYGGIKLGVSGLINAYRTAARLTLENASVIEKTIDSQFLIECKYDELSKIMRLIKLNQATILEQHMTLNCQIKVSIREKKSTSFVNSIKLHHRINIKKI